MKACQWCKRALEPIPATDGFFVYCPDCDRRTCTDCGYAEQDVSATRCSSCKAEYAR